MNSEEEARSWIRARYGAQREAMVAGIADRVVLGSTRQNLVAPSTLQDIWQRHLLDSAQLAPLAASAPDGIWLDIGSGAGFPGLVVAALTDRPTLLVEPRRLRAEFLRDTASAVGLANIEVTQSRVEAVQRKAALISARAVARLDALFTSAYHCSTLSTIWLLPKGRTAQDELAEAKVAWHGVFHVEPSLTSTNSSIVVAQGVRPR
jgi:16S rRNA (guanine527-N7)-methyltransferase